MESSDARSYEYLFSLKYVEILICIATVISWFLTIYDIYNFSFQTLLKEAEGKQVLVESVDKRMSALHSELEPSEIQQLEGGWLRLLESEVAELCAALRGELDRVGNAAHDRKTFEDNLTNARNKLRTMASTDLDPAKEHPLTAAAIEKDLDHFKVCCFK